MRSKFATKTSSQRKRIALPLSCNTKRKELNLCDRARSTDRAKAVFDESFFRPARAFLIDVSFRTPSSEIYRTLGQLAADAHGKLKMLSNDEKHNPKLAPLPNNNRKMIFLKLLTKI